jgi:hypothetical protein
MLNSTLLAKCHPDVAPVPFVLPNPLPLIVSAPDNAERVVAIRSSKRTFNEGK